MCAARLVAATLIAAVAGPAPVMAGAPSPPADWTFEAKLDGKPIGWHRFTLEREGQGDGLRLTSQARFEVKLLGFTAYRYLHSAVEHWRGDCLTALRSSTD